MCFATILTPRARGLIQFYSLCGFPRARVLEFARAIAIFRAFLNGSFPAGIGKCVHVYCRGIARAAGEICHCDGSERERDVIAIRVVGWLKFSRRRNKKEIWRDFVALSFGMS